MLLRYTTYFVLTMVMLNSCKHTQSIQVEQKVLPNTEFLVNKILPETTNGKINIDDFVTAPSTTQHKQNNIYTVNKSTFISRFDTNGVFLNQYNIKFKATQITYLTQLETKYKGKRDVFFISSNFSNSLRCYSYDSVSNDLEDITSGEFLSSVDEIKFITAYYSVKLQQHFLIVVGKRGMVEQWKLQDDGFGHIEAKIVRVFNLIDIPTAVCIDSWNEKIYFAVKNEGIYKISAQPMGGTSTTPLLTIKASEGFLDNEMGGMCFVQNNSKEGILLFSGIESSKNMLIDIASEKIINKVNIYNTIENKYITNINCIKTLNNNLFLIKSNNSNGLYTISKK